VLVALEPGPDAAWPAERVVAIVAWLPHAAPKACKLRCQGCVDIRGTGQASFTTGTVGLCTALLAKVPIAAVSAHVANDRTSNLNVISEPMLLMCR